MDFKKLGFNSYGAFRVDKVRQIIHAPFVFLKKHYCTECHSQLKLGWVTQLIGEGTPEAMGKDLLFGFSGKPVEYTFAILKCPKCGKKISINEQFFLEKPKRLKKYESKYGDYRNHDDYYSYLRSIQEKDQPK